MRASTSINRWKWVLLIFELTLFAVILILPQVDLPDFTFHGGTAPVVVKARSSQVPSRTIAAVFIELFTNDSTVEFISQTASRTLPENQNLRLSLLCTLIC